MPNFSKMLHTFFSYTALSRLRHSNPFSYQISKVKGKSLSMCRKEWVIFTFNLYLKFLLINVVVKDVALANYQKRSWTISIVTTISNFGILVSDNVSVTKARSSYQLGIFCLTSENRTKVKSRIQNLTNFSKTIII